jgi:hypothetical protein
MQGQNPAEMSTEDLHRRHRDIRAGKEEEEDMPEERRPYGFRENTGIREQAEEIEKELDRRGEKYRKITW